MKSFKEYYDDLNKIKSKIEDQESRLQQHNDLYAEYTKMFYEISKTLEYGLKEETKLKEAVAKAISIAKAATSYKPDDFSAWNKMNRRGSYYSQPE